MFYNRVFFAEYLCKYIKSFNNSYENKHITSVFYITLEEIAKMFMEGKKVRIGGFVNLKLIARKPNLIYNYVYKEHTMRKSYKKIKIVFNERLEEYLRKNIDFDNILPVEDDENE